MFTADKIQSLNELELSVYEYVIQHKTVIPYIRIRELAGEVHVSTTTILRFPGADPELTEEFVRMGIDELSVSPSMVVRLRKNIRNIL